VALVGVTCRSVARSCVMGGRNRLSHGCALALSLCATDVGMAAVSLVRASVGRACARKSRGCHVVSASGGVLAIALSWRVANLVAFW